MEPLHLAPRLRAHHQRPLQYLYTNAESSDEDNDEVDHHRLATGASNEHNTYECIEEQHVLNPTGRQQLETFGNQRGFQEGISLKSSPSFLERNCEQDSERIQEAPDYFPSYEESDTAGHLDPSEPPTTGSRFRPWGQLLGGVGSRQYSTLPLSRPPSASGRRPKGAGAGVHPQGAVPQRGRLPRTAGLSSSSSPTSEDEEANHSDATFTGSELALARDTTLVLQNSRLLDGPVNHSAIPPRTLSMGRTGCRPVAGGPNAPPDVSNNGPMRDHPAEREFESCLARTPSGSVFIPSDGFKCQATSPQKSELHVPQRGSIHADETKNNPDRCHLSYTTGGGPVPALPVRNNLRRPMSSHFANSRFHIRKTLSSRCSWKCTAIAFIIVSLVLLAALAYFIADSILSGQYASILNCPVMVDDMGVVAEGTRLKSTYYEDPDNFKVDQGPYYKPRVRVIRQVPLFEKTDQQSTPIADSLFSIEDLGSGDLGQPQNQFRPTSKHSSDENAPESGRAVVSRQERTTTANTVESDDINASPKAPMEEMRLPPIKPDESVKKHHGGHIEITDFKSPGAKKHHEGHKTYHKEHHHITPMEELRLGPKATPNGVNTITTEETLDRLFKGSHTSTHNPMHKEIVEEGLIVDDGHSKKSTSSKKIYSSHHEIDHSRQPPKSMELFKVNRYMKETTTKVTVVTEEFRPQGTTKDSQPKETSTVWTGHGFVITPPHLKPGHSHKGITNNNHESNTEGTAQRRTTSKQDDRESSTAWTGSEFVHTRTESKPTGHEELSEKIPITEDDSQELKTEETVEHKVTAKPHDSVEDKNIQRDDVAAYAMYPSSDINTTDNEINSLSPFLYRPDTSLVLEDDVDDTVNLVEPPPTNDVSSKSPTVDSTEVVTLDGNSFSLDNDKVTIPTQSEDEFDDIEELLPYNYTGPFCTCKVTRVSHDDVVTDAPDDAIVSTPVVVGSQMLPSKTIPPKSDTFYEVQLGKKNTHNVPPYGHWNIQFHQRDPSLVKFNYSLPYGASLGVFGRRNGIPSHTRYDFLEVLSARERRAKRSPMDSFNVEFIQFLDRGLWYISIYNDGDKNQEITFVSVLTDESSLPCPYDCHGHGTCTMGHCMCDTDYAGDSCAYRVCPVLCSGRGQYMGGECLCSAGWKGRECQVRDDECEVSDCSGHGDCIDGLCRCFPGYKGQNCEEVDCLDPDCSGHGVCVSGMCLCRKGWKGADCNEPDSEALRCLPDCSGHGQFDPELQRCVCDERWTGPDCSQEKCNLDCGQHGHCQGGECVCLDGWSGVKCNEKLCDPRCQEHGQCKNGTCLCIQGWNGQHCTLEGCVRNCNNHGDCIMTEDDWHCECESDWNGPDCSVPLEKNCDDRIDNDNDGLIDCADSECCQSKACQNNPLCFSSADPLDILLRKQPPAVTASFFQRMQFLIEEDSVQSYARKNAFNDSRASVIRGQVVSPTGSGLMGIRVGVATDPLFGFTVTRETGWFDLMVNGGGAVTLHFQREPFKPHERTVVVPWNEIIVINKVILSVDESKRAEFKSPVCQDHDFDSMKPVVLATWKHGFQGGCPERSSVLVESQVVQESVAIPGTALHLVYHSSRVGGYQSTIQLQLTPDTIPPTLRLIHLRISIEGILFEKVFEADPGIKFTYAWNRRNVYRQKVYGVTTAVVYVGFEYSTCPYIIWEIQTTQVSGHDMSISDIGGWNMDIHNRYNFHEGILQKGDGTNTYLQNKPKVMLTSMGNGQQRPLHCEKCDGVAKEQQLLAPVALAGGPDGSVYVGDFNLIRRITPDGVVKTVVELSAAQVAYRYHLAIGPADGKLYISDPEKHQVLRAIDLSVIPDVTKNTEAVVGNGGRCLPGDKLLCGDGRPARDAQLAYPKGIAISPYGEIYIADGTNIRMVDRGGIIHTLIGDHYHKSHWKPIPCGRTVPATQVSLRWPTELAINPLDGSLHILDDHMVLKLTQDKRLKIVTGRALHCPTSTQGREKSDLATEVYLESPQSIAFGSNGDLYVAESDSQMVNRVRVVGSDGRIYKFAGAESKCSCLDINCKCFDDDHYLAATSKLNTISSITMTPNGHLHICDRGNLRIRSVMASLPKPNQHQEYEIYAPETQEVYVFNRHGQHISTKNILTGKTIYTFSYNVNTSFGKLSSITNAAGNKIYILRDYNNHVNSIENTQGGKCRLEMSRMKMLQSFTTPENFKTTFDYHGSTGLIKSKSDSSGRVYIYGYDAYGRLVKAVTPSGQIIGLMYNLSIKGASVTVTRNDKNPVSMLIKGSDVSTRIGMVEERITQYPDGSIVVTSQDSSSLSTETVPSPVLSDLNPILGETFPVPAKMKLLLSDAVMQRIEWRYYLRKEGKGSNRQVTQVGRKMKVNGETLLSVEFDREHFSETVFDRNQVALVKVKYNEPGNPLRWDPTMNITGVELEYDRFGRISRWERGLLSERYSFDIQGRLAEVRYADNSGVMYKYEEAPTSLPNEIILPSGSRYLLHYDSYGSLQAIVTPNSHKHEIATQTSLGFYKLLYLAPGVKNPFVIHFNDRGQVISKMYPKNKGRVVYVYNNEGRLDVELCGDEKTEFHYHEQTGILKSVVKTIPDIDFLKADYRYQGALIKEEKHRYGSRSGLDGAKFKFKYEGRLSGVEVEINGKTNIETKYRFNGETGMLEQVQQFMIHQLKINSFFIQDESRQYSKSIGFDSYGRLVQTSITIWNKEVYSMFLHYDNRNRVTRSMVRVGKEPVNIVQNYTYTLDGFVESCSGLITWQFIYDINGNMKSQWEGERQLTLRYDDGDRLTGYGDVELYVVDSRGFVVQRGEEKFRFNAKGELTLAFELHQYEVRYTYDAYSRLVARRDHRGNITQFFYANPMKPNQVTHVHFPKDGSNYLLIYDTNDHLIHILHGNNKYYVATDHLGSPVAVFDAEGNTVKDIRRTPFGKVIYDSNMEFFVPLDYQGGLRDPQTQLVHFGGRVYDPHGAQWLTPNWEKIPDLLKEPYKINLYRFHDNDPVNPPNKDELHLTEMPEWMSSLGFDMKSMLIQPRPAIDHQVTLRNRESLPTISGLSCASEIVKGEFHRFTSMPKTEARVDNLVLRSINFRIANLPPVIGHGILISRKLDRALVHFVNEAGPIDRDVFSAVFNETYMVDFSFSQLGQDMFFFAQESRDKAQEDWDQLQRLGSAFNVTLQAVDSSEATGNGQVDLKMHSTSVVLNIRYGTNLDDEKRRLLRGARRKAVEEAWQLEADLVRGGYKGSNAWTKVEKDELLASGKVSTYYGTDIYDITKYPQLADDPTNIVFKKESSRKKRNRSRRPKL